MADRQLDSMALEPLKGVAKPLFLPGLNEYGGLPRSHHAGKRWRIAIIERGK